MSRHVTPPAVQLLQKEVAKIGLQKHHGIPVDETQANQARETFAGADPGQDVLAALDRLLLCDRWVVDFDFDFDFDLDLD